MNTTENSKQKPVNVVAFAFLLTAFLTGIASSFQTPTLSLFLAQEIQVSPFMVGMFYTSNAVLGIVLSQILAKYSDSQDDRRKIIIFCSLLAIGGCITFAYNRNYYVLMFFATFLLSLGSSANPQAFALAREYADYTKREAIMFTTIMRTQISLAWIVGPPLSFSIALGWGFEYMYMVAASAFLLCAIIAKALLPYVPRKAVVSATKPDEVAGLPAKNKKQSDKQSIRLLFITCFLMWSCNGMYLISMPLHVINELHLSERLAGILMGTAAGLEIPVMLIAGYLTKYLTKKSLILTALFMGLFFYIGMLFAEQTWQLVALQAFNAIFIGIIATLGMVYFQDLMPGKMGSATTLFSNAAKSSWIVAGPFVGIIAQIWNYSSVFYISIVLVAVSLFSMSKVKSV
ncbi:MFS transporter [Basfia succiniciproducens]|uniref:MFS transporter, SET family, sugar efflux transporter n=1 Tax=Basfia succiniciproducens TaxID=653940 RepID=A0A1G5ADW1_9PAST|nr:MFS transporter [Basfia succiniciproducens]QIM68535.1 sugar transporter [Basfia succiniciproducens]SCX76045.1 MFS transporter, SET family, sugar efflux transporter [Basfia succiniciproducens]